MSEGFRLAGFEPVRAVESDRRVAENYTANRPNSEMLTGDIRQFTNDTLLAGIDIVIGGPPCQGFSMSGKRMVTDKRNFLPGEFIRVAMDPRVRAAVMENVEGLTRGNMRVFLKWIVAQMRTRFESVVVVRLNGKEAMLPQSRTRIFIVGSDTGLWPLVVHAGRRATVRDAIGEIPRGTPNHDIQPLTYRMMSRIGELKEGEGLHSTFTQEGHRLHWDRPAPTVLVGSSLVHPGEDRFLTIREYARLQGFPDTFTFHGPWPVQKKCVGNAVPPPMAMVVADALGRTIDGYG